MAKISVYINDEAWKRFREQVFSRYGTLRRLSGELEQLVASEDMERMVLLGARRIGVSIEQDVSPLKIKKGRPKLKGPAAETILREMRDQHHAGRVSR